MSKYNFELDLNNNNSLGIIVDMIEKNSRILEFGPANGRLTKYLKEHKNCEITIVEIDEEAGNEAMQYADKGIVGVQDGDVEKYNWTKQVKEDNYDYIIFADVLEHLYNPKQVLKSVAPYLKEKGEVIVSVPNIAHNSIIIELIKDQFNYTDIGILDDTHIRFFTRTSFSNMVKAIGEYDILQVMYTYAKVGSNEIANDYSEINPYISKGLQERFNGNVYQNIFVLGKRHQENYLEKGEDQAKELLTNELVIYFKNDNEDYEEKNTIKVSYNRTKRNLKIKIDGNSFGNKTNLRIDLMDMRGIVRLNSIKIKDKSEVYYLDNILSNAALVVNKIYMFDTQDPQLYCSLKQESIEELVIEFEIIECCVDISEYVKLATEIIKDNQDEKNLLIQSLKNVEQEVSEKVFHIQHLEEVTADRTAHIQHLEAIASNQKVELEHLAQSIGNHMCHINHLEEVAADRAAHINHLEQLVGDKVSKITQLESVLKSHEKHIQEQQEVIAIQLSKIQNLEKDIMRYKEEQENLVKTIETYENELEIIRSKALGKFILRKSILKSRRDR